MVVADLSMCFWCFQKLPDVGVVVNSSNLSIWELDQEFKAILPV